MRQIVGAERKELRFLGDLVGHQRRPWQLDHGAHQVVHVRLLFREHLFRDADDNFLLVARFLERAHQRNHDLGIDFHPVLGHGAGRLEDGARLHFRDLGIGDAQAAAAMAQHGVELVQLFHAPQERTQFTQLG